MGTPRWQGGGPAGPRIPCSTPVCHGHGDTLLTHCVCRGAVAVRARVAGRPRVAYAEEEHSHGHERERCGRRGERHGRGDGKEPVGEERVGKPHQAQQVSCQLAHHRRCGRSVRGEAPGPGKEHCRRERRERCVLRAEQHPREEPCRSPGVVVPVRASVALTSGERAYYVMPRTQHLHEIRGRALGHVPSRDPAGPERARITGAPGVREDARTRAHPSPVLIHKHPAAGTSGSCGARVLLWGAHQPARVGVHDEGTREVRSPGVARGASAVVRPL
mmetsp:Transcript_5139/g.15000  ORF Transcript_5139/g.15000 Transcript_5139/m.15000 type:complete len:275 (+) Transcript_5139:3152-3976(+)